MEDVEAKKIPSQSVKFQYLASIVGKKENHLHFFIFPNNFPSEKISSFLKI